MDHASLLLHGAPVSHRHYTTVAPCRTWPRRSLLAGCVLLVWMDDASACAALTLTLAWRATVCGAHGRARAPHDRRGAAACHGVSGGGDRLGAATILAARGRCLPHNPAWLRSPGGCCARRLLQRCSTPSWCGCGICRNFTTRS